MSRVTKDNHTSSQGNKKIGHTKETEHGGARQLGPLHLVSRAVSVVAILVGSSVLVGWTLDVDVLKRIFPGLVAMNPATAIAFVLAGLSLWLVQAQNRTSGLRRIARGLAFAVALVGLIKLVGILSGWDVGIDQLLFRGRLESEAAVTGIPNRMAPNTALNFFLLGGALLLVDRQNHRSYWLAQLLIVVSLAASVLAIVGYAYGVTSFYGVASFIPMALHTALTFVVLSVGLLCVRPDHGLMAIVTSDSMGGVVVRRLLPAAILVQIALGWLRLVGQQAGLYGTELGVALMVVSSTVILTALIAWIAGLLYRSDTERKRAEEQLRQSYEELDLRVQERTTELAEANAHLRAGIAEREQFAEALKESEVHKTAVMEGALDCIITMDHAGLITDFNPAAEQTFGYRRAEVLGRGLAETIIPPSLRDAHRRGLARYLATGEGPLLNRRIEVPGMRADGTEFPVELAIVPMRLGEQPMFVGYLHDITERKRNEETLRESEERFRLLVEGVKDYAIFMLDPEGRVSTWNEGAKRNKGYEAEEIIGEHFSTFYTQEDVERGHPEEELRIAAREGRYEEEGLRVRKDGSRFWANVVITALRDEEGNLRGFAKVVRDITERKRAENQLERRARLLDLTQDAILVRDSEDRIILWNRGAEGMYGWKSEEALGRISHELLKTRFPESLEQATSKLLRDGRWEGELWHTKRDGTTIVTASRWALQRDEHADPVSILETNTDITERKRYEEELSERAEELARSNAELEQFAYVASHDLQEPLRMVSSYTQLLARRYKGQLDSDADEFISYAVDGATRMQTLIHDLLAFSRVGTAGKELVPTDTADVFDAACANLRSAIEESGAQVTSEELPTVMGDRTQLGQLFQNLIGNAIKFRGEGPVHVDVGAERRDGEWLFSVRDNGIGIEPEYAERIFVVFQRLHARAEFSGTGIGLAVCKKIVERHGGRIWVESEPGEGSTFYFTLRSVEGLPDHE